MRAKTYVQCTCKTCKEFNASPLNREKHGTANQYFSHGCRCDACRAAASAHGKAKRQGAKDAMRTTILQLGREALQEIVRDDDHKDVYEEKLKLVHFMTISILAAKNAKSSEMKLIDAEWNMHSILAKLRELSERAA
jgi:hypothetical protein